MIKMIMIMILMMIKMVMIRSEVDGSSMIFSGMSSNATTSQSTPLHQVFLSFLFFCSSPSLPGATIINLSPRISLYVGSWKTFLPKYLRAKFSLQARIRPSSPFYLLTKSVTDYLTDMAQKIQSINLLYQGSRACLPLQNDERGLGNYLGDNFDDDHDDTLV